ncbi:TPA: AraC family transcriptional regulator [Aeromonas veronii]
MVDYQARLRPVIRALEQNPELCLSEAASLAALSSYHFHRVFTAVTGETPAEMQRRLRMERAARSLRYSRDPVTEIALSAGFASSQAFAKAFRKQFAMAPGMLRRQPSLLQLSKNGHAAARGAGYAESRSHERRQPMKTEQMAPRTLAYIRVTGPYGTGYEPVCDQLYQWSAEQGLAEAEWIFIYHDNPEITAPQQCRTDICVTVPAGTKGSGSVEIQSLAGGRYALTRTTVTDQAQYPLLWQQHIGDIVAAGHELDDRPCFELYHSYDPVTKVADVSFCSSLKG